MICCNLPHDGEGVEEGGGGEVKESFLLFSLVMFDSTLNYSAWRQEEHGDKRERLFLPLAVVVVVAAPGRSAAGEQTLPSTGSPQAHGGPPVDLWPCYPRIDPASSSCQRQRLPNEALRMRHGQASDKTLFLLALRWN